MSWAEADLSDHAPEYVPNCSPNLERTDIIKILFAGDLHGHLTRACQVVDRAVELDVDLIMQAGDFGIWTHTQAGVVFLDRLQQYLEMHSKMLYFVDGNHENFDHLYDIPLEMDGLRKVRDRIIHIPRGHTINFEGTRIMGFGGANSIDGPDGASWWSQGRGMYNDQRTGMQVDLGGWWSQEEITQDQVNEVEEDYIDILLTHECPYGIHIPGINKDYPAGRRQRQLMLQVVEKVRPKLLVHGHYHRRHTSRIGDTRIEGLGDNMGTLNDLILFVDTEERL